MVKGNSLDNLIVDGDVMLAYTYTGNNKPSKFPAMGEGYYITDLTCTGGTAIWDNDTWTMKITETSGQSISCNAIIIDIYKDNSGAATPVIKGDLIPVIISDTGVVTKANIGEKWYDYDESIWANAVILQDNYGPYKDGDIIPEEAIESYFVWIPRYRYKIFDEGKYTSLTSKEAAEQEIEVVFENNKTESSTGSSEGTWLTHPAFTSFDNNNGFWVGKFENGYRGAISTTDAEKNVINVSMLINKPNVYSWRYNKVGNMFKVCYDYKRELDSHMMKNTEWGAVTYLSHSKYGTINEVRINNNSAYITGYSAINDPNIFGNKYGPTVLGEDGSLTINYFNSQSVLSSTTGNYSGIYDMSGGAYEHVAGYNTESSIGVGGYSDITSIISDFFESESWQKYYDKYNSNNDYSFNNRILGDATGEMGPFNNYIASWYNDYSRFVAPKLPWFERGYMFDGGISAGLFSTATWNGEPFSNIGFRVILTPQ